LLALGGGLGVLIALHGLARWTRRLEHGKAVYCVVATAALVAAAAIAMTAGRSALSGLFLEINRFSPWRAQGYVNEAMPLMQSEAWRPIPLWSDFTTSLFLCLIALPTCLGRAASRRGTGMRLLLLWAMVSLAATFGQVRFAYYLAIGVALLAGCCCGLISNWLAPAPVMSADGASERRANVAAGRLTVRQTAVAITLALVIVLPGLPALAREAQLQSQLTPERFDALQWMRTNTPEPFGDPDAYYDSQVSRPSRYGVLAWWDFGYWVSRIGRRVPVTNPRQSGVEDAAAFFLAEEPTQASQVLDRTGVRYVMVDALLQAAPERTAREWYGFFGAMALAGDRPSSAYCGIFRPMGGGGQEPVLYCYPEYYRTMAVRLYAFGGEAVAPQSIWVIEVGEATPNEPLPITAEWSFATYEEALRFSRTRPAGQLRIVSKSLLSSCVPLEAAADYGLVYRSLGKQDVTAAGAGPSVVQIFEYRPQPES
jgi:dolichyl-diphosphooligosaccharide--protein glycosyltransferase